MIGTRGADTAVIAEHHMEAPRSPSSEDLRRVFESYCFNSTCRVAFAIYERRPDEAHQDAAFAHTCLPSDSWLGTGFARIDPIVITARPNGARQCALSEASYIASSKS